MSLLLVFSGFCLGYVVGTTNILEHPVLSVVALGGVIAVLLAEYLTRKAQRKSGN